MKEIVPKNESKLFRFERAAVKILTPFVPGFVGTKTLTVLSLIAALLSLASYFFALSNRVFLLFAALFVILQWVFDCLDGHIGRLRGEGFVKWGFFMDHFVDFQLVAYTMIGFHLLMPGSGLMIIILFMLIGSFMVQSFLFDDSEVAGEKSFQTSFFGISPIELRLFAIVFDVAMYIWPAVSESLFTSGLPYVNAVFAFFLIISIWMNQRKMSEIDLKRKNK